MPSKKPVITVTAQSEDGATTGRGGDAVAPAPPRNASPGAQIAPAAESPGPPRIPRITRLMALAIKFQDMVDRGEVRDYADLARLGYVTRARLTQIMNLLSARARHPGIAAVRNPIQWLRRKTPPGGVRRSMLVGPAQALPYFTSSISFA